MKAKFMNEVDEHEMRNQNRLLPKKFINEEEGEKIYVGESSPGVGKYNLTNSGHDFGSSGTKNKFSSADIWIRADPKEWSKNKKFIE